MTRGARGEPPGGTGEVRPVAPGLFTLEGGGALLAGRCAACGRLHFPRGETCPYCGGDRCPETPLSREGRLYLYTSVQTAPPGYRGPVPFGFGVVELPEGLRVIARLTEADPARLSRGMPVQLTFEAVATDEEGRALVTYAFAPRADRPDRGAGT